MHAKCQKHRNRLRTLAVTAVEAAEKACEAHIQTEGELSTIDAGLQEKVSRAAYAAAAEDGLTAQVRLRPGGRLLLCTFSDWQSNTQLSCLNEFPVHVPCRMLQCHS